MAWCWRLVPLLLLLFSIAGSVVDEDTIFSDWAEELGSELWQLANSVMEVDDFKTRYKYMNARVEERDGSELLRAINENVERMMRSKMKSVKVHEIATHIFVVMMNLMALCFWKSELSNMAGYILGSVTYAVLHNLYSRFTRRKLRDLFCIMQKAEEIAEEFEFESFNNFSYYNAKYSTVDGKGHEDYINETLYAPMSLIPDKQFQNIPVNRNYSSVHVPTNIYDGAPGVLEAIQWSQGLDETFKRNSRIDPSISWQYFGGSSGFMRTYPALQWLHDPDLYDCRSRSWYIEASTCSKDVVILVDTTGSMTGMRHYIARLTVNSLLDTFSNNDFVNVFNFSSHAQEVVPCFKDTLVQATLENINTLKAGMDKIVKPEGYANFSQAFIQAFQLLEKSRLERGISDNDTGVQCNQAIMLITDSVAGNVTDVFQAYNRLNNGTTIPVRVFTFLIGKEVTKVMEIMWMACLNRGFYKHIQSLNEVSEQVFQYISVIARPLALQREVHPIIWTHAYADIRDPKIEQWLWDVMETGEQKEKLDKHFRNKEFYFSQRGEDNVYAQTIFKKFKEPEELRFQEYHLVTSVAIPAFDRRLNYENVNETDTPVLLGVAAVDVPIPDIEKLTSPFKTGVNAYTFIVTNNGYLLSHPDLRPVSRGALKDNYNSVDLTEVELVDDTRGPRELNPETLELREAMVNHEEGEIPILTMKYHFDDMKRVISENRSYYYAPLNGTPFSIGLSLPHGYGLYVVKVGDVIKDTLLKGKSLLSYFEGSNWKIHPTWLYCKHFYQYLHHFESSEQELLHFLHEMSKSDFHWKNQYGEDIKDQDENDYNKNSTEYINCNQSEIREDEYYCDHELMQLLVFDAKITQEFFKGKLNLTNEEEELVRLYNTTLMFVATHSGLTRWQSILVEDEDKDASLEFGDIYYRSIEEPWYKSAVLQHELDPKSLVISVPFDAGNRDNAPVTVAYAVYPRDAGKEAPAAVLGIQLQHSALFSQFLTITSKNQGPDDMETKCQADGWDCYLIDNNGYIVISEILNDTGRFFGEVEGAVMESLMHSDIFRKIRIFDYQALCFEEVPKDKSAANFIWTPINFTKWLLTELVIMLANFNIKQLWSANWVSAYSLTVIEDEDYFGSFEGDVAEGEVEEEEQIEMPAVNETDTIHEPCDQKSNLYLLQYEALKADKPYLSSHPTACAPRPFFLKRVPHTNLLLIVVNSLYQSCYKRLSSAPKVLIYNNTEHPCQKMQLNNLTRTRFSACFTEHPLENSKKMCGDASHSKLNFLGMAICGSMLLMNYIFQLIVLF